MRRWGWLWLAVFFAACVPDGAEFQPPDGGAPDEDAGTVEDAGRADASSLDASNSDAEIFDSSGPPPTGFELELDSPSIDEGGSTALRSFEVYPDRSRVDITASSEWSVDSATTAAIVAGGRVFGRGPGTTRVNLRSNGVTLASAQLRVSAVGELRGVWISRWLLTDPNVVAGIVDDAASANLNAIFVQVRGEADALYQSSLEPWSRVLTGTLGEDPGWDPLDALLTAAHARGIQVHAWLNTFAAWQAQTPPIASTPEHVLRAHPDWLCADESGTPMAPGDESYQFLSPGNPEVRDHIASVVEEMASNYELDGVHFDYVRYPGPQYCHDAASETEYARARTADPSLEYEAFQRANVGLLLEDARARVAAVRPSAVVTAATWGIYRNVWNWSGVSKGYDDYYQDAHAYVQSGFLDALVPMTYWALAPSFGERLDFAALTDAHVRAAAQAGRYSFAGINAEHDSTEVLAEVDAARALGARGVVFFELGLLRSNGHLTALRNGPFAAPAVVPPFAFRDAP